MQNIEVVRVDQTQLRRQRWDFNITTGRSRIEAFISEYHIETRRSTRATRWTGEHTFFARSKRRGHIVSSDEVPPLPDDVIAEVRERITALITVTISLPESTEANRD